MTASPASSSAATTGPAPGRSTAQGRAAYRRGAGRRAAARDGDALRRQPRDVRADRQLQIGPGARAGHPGAAGPMTGTALQHRRRAAAAVAGDRRASARSACCSSPSALWRRARGAAVAHHRRSRCCSLALVNPSLVEEKREPQRDVAIVVVDEFAEPADRRAPALRPTRRWQRSAIASRASRDLDVRVVHAGKPQPGAGDDGTRLFTALTRAHRPTCRASASPASS